MTNAYSTPATPLHLAVDIGGGEVSWGAWVPGDPVWEEGATVTRGKQLSHGRATIKARKLTLGVAGAGGRVLPRGRLAALMAYAGPKEKMDMLCEAVLRRYAAHYKCHPTAPHRLCVQAYQAIRRAWASVAVPKHYRYLPGDFWRGEVKPGKGIVWPVTYPVRIRLKGTPLCDVVTCELLDNLLTPAGNLPTSPI